MRPKLKAIGGARALGGPVSGGVPYLVGERGPEIMVPRMAGTVIPNHGIGAAGAVEVTVQVLEDGKLQAYVTRTAGNNVTAKGMAAVRGDVPRIMAETNRRMR